MLAVKVNGTVQTYPEGTTYLEIAEDFKDLYKEEILLVRVNGKLKELHKKLKKDAEVEFITYDDPVSIRHKGAYVTQNGLMGMMCWEYGSDYEGELLQAMYEGMNQ